MPTGIKFVWGAAVAMTLMCVVGSIVALGVAQNLKPDGGQTANRIADFTLPAGYREEYVVNIGGYLAVSYYTGDGHSHIFLIQGPPDLRIDRDSIWDMLPAYDRTTRLTVVETRSIVVRDQDTPLTISEGANSDGVAYRELAVPFQGKGGPALLVMSEPLTRWDRATVFTFVASIR